MTNNEYTICSNTLVKNGQPFIGPVLRQVEPYMHRMIITISRKADYKTKEDVLSFKNDFTKKVVLMWEKVPELRLLTQERQKQLDQTTEDWVLFLDDDDWWPRKDLERLLEHLGDDVEGFAVNPLQMIDKNHYDWSWRYRWFTKLFKNHKGVKYYGDWPRDLICNTTGTLYWRENERVPQFLDSKYFHLSSIKNYSFRDDCEHYNRETGELREMPDEYKVEAEKIYEYLRKDK